MNTSATIIAGLTILVIVLLGVIAVLSIDSAGHGSTQIQPTTITKTETVSSTVSTTVTKNPIASTMTTNSASQLYEIIFNETGYCYPPATYPAPWAVTLNNSTIVQPANATLPLQQGTIGYNPANKNYSMIIFSVPDGTYSYEVQPSSIFRQSSTVVVNGSNVLVQVQVNGAVIPCTAHT